MEFHIENTQVYGLDTAMIASGNSYRTKIEMYLKDDFEYWEQFGNFLVDFYNYYYNYNKYIGKNTKKSCCVCGASPATNYHKTGKYYCNKHIKQLYRHGEIFETTPEYVLHDTYVEIKVRNTKGEINSTIISYASLPVVFYNYPTSIKIYAKCKDGKALHNVIMNHDADVKIAVDHINKNKLDNRLSNLRLVTHQQNDMNGVLKKNNTSSIIGVSFRKDRNCWRAYLNKDYKTVCLGSFKNKDDAIKARLTAENLYFGEYAPQHNLFEQYGIVTENQKEGVKEQDHHLLKVLQSMKRLSVLGTTPNGCGEDQALTGIVVTFDLYAPLYMWKQLQRYHFLDFISSQSTMHCLTKFKIKDCCVEDTDSIILNRYQELLDEYNNSEVKDVNKWRTLVASLPCGFILGASMVTNYRQLKVIVKQRENHRLKEWHEFCDWCKSLPYFKELVLTKNDN